MLSGLLDKLSAIEGANHICAGGSVHNPFSVFRIAVNSQEMLSPNEKGDRIAAFERTRDVALIESSALDNDFATARALNEDRGATPGLTEKDRTTLERTIRAEENRFDTQGRETRLAAERLEMDSFLSRINDPNDPAGFPTVREVLDSSMAPNVKEHYLIFYN